MADQGGRRDDDSICDNSMPQMYRSMYRDMETLAAYECLLHEGIMSAMRHTIASVAGSVDTKNSMIRQAYQFLQEHSETLRILYGHYIHHNKLSI